MRDPSTQGGGEEICSQYAGDPDMIEIVEMFVREMPRRVSALRQALDKDDHASLRTLSHQLKGAAPGYGFPTIGEQAARLETSLRDGEASRDALRGQLDDLIALCERARAA